MFSCQRQQNASDIQAPNKTNTNNFSLLDIGNKFITDQKISEYILDLDEFTIIKQIGNGGFADVFLVENKTTKKQYAAKVSLIDSTHLQEKDSFSTEVQILINVNNPAVIRIIGFSLCDFNNNPYPSIILDYMPNGTLAQIINEDQNDSTEWTCTKRYINLLGIAIGMEYLHSHNIVQRDLKPQNILLDEHYYPYISDFGISKKLEILNTQNIMTTGNGSLLYMAPEFYKDCEYTYKVDVYSYSLIAYQLITSKKPVPNEESIMKFIYQVPNGKRPDISMINNQFQIDFLKKCWSNDPNERPSFSKIVKILKNKKFYSTLDVDLDEVNKYLSLFSDQEPILRHSSVKELFQSPNRNFTVETVLECSDVIEELKNENIELCSYFINDDTNEKMIDLLIEDNSNETHQKIMNIILNLNFGQCFVDSSLLMDYSFQKLESKKKDYAIRTFSKIIYDIYSHSPSAFHSTFYSSKKLYNIIIRNIVNDCICHTIQEIMSFKWLDLFIWLLFKSLSGNEFNAKVLKNRIPRKTFLYNNRHVIPNFYEKYNKAKNEIKKKAIMVKITKSLELLHLFFKNVKIDHRYNDFREFIVRHAIYIFDEEYFNPIYLKVVKYCSYCDELQSKVIDKLQKHIEQQSMAITLANKDDQFIYHSLDYLSKFTPNISKEDFLKITISLFNEHYAQSTLLKLIKFISKFFSVQKNDLYELRQIIDKLVIHSWNYCIYIINNKDIDDELKNQYCLLRNLVFKLFITAHTQLPLKHDDDDDDDSDSIKGQIPELIDVDSNWSSPNNLNNIQNIEFINNINKWTSGKELNLNSPFKNVPDDIIDELNKYKLGMKFQNIPTSL